ncbi:MAG: methyltransferase domain-containing protein [Thermotaleaceae bacterium]
MSFYEEISKYYDYIFPVGEAQIKLISEIAKEPPKDLLDIACGTGGYSIELAKQGYKITAVDLDGKMIEELNSKVRQHHLNINALQGDMLDLKKSIDSTFDLAFCIGNSLVHLQNEIQIGIFLKEARTLLRDSGSLVIQIINYDRVLASDIRSLPTIENREIGLKFQRIYRYDTDNNKIFFKTILEVDEKKLENEIALYPILSKNLIKLLHGAGFDHIQPYGDFKQSPFDKNNSYALVVVAS